MERANEWLYKNADVQVRSCETVTWMSHDAKRLGDGEQMLLTQSIEENGSTACLRGFRWATPVVDLSPDSEDSGRQHLPFLQILVIVAFLFFSRTDSTDSPDCLPILLSVSVFYFLIFRFFHFLLFWFRAVD